jgi:hypothetical protein
VETDGPLRSVYLLTIRDPDGQANFLCHFGVFYMYIR